MLIKRFAIAPVFGVILCIAVLAAYFLLGPVNASSLISARDALSDSAPGAAATHSIGFETSIEISAGGYMEAIFAPEFDLSSAQVACPDGTASSTGIDYVRCTVDPGETLASRTPYSILVAGAINPAVTGTYDFGLAAYSSAGGELESSSLKVVIIESVITHAYIESTLEFESSGIASGTVVNGIECQRDTTATHTPLGLLGDSASTTACQQLSVVTNSENGFTLTVHQDHELINETGDTINSFNNSPDGTGSTTPAAWEPPAVINDQNHTYGHIGLTTDDYNLSTDGPYGDFTGGKFAGLNGSAPMVVLAHSGMGDGVTQGIGLVRLAFTAEISPLQEPGDYTNSLTYIITPIY